MNGGGNELSSLIISELMLSMLLVIEVVIALYFSMNYEMDNDATWSGVIAFLIWVVLGFTMLIGFGETEFVTISFFPHGIGILYLVRVLVDIISMRTAGRRLDSDSDFSH